MRVLTAAVCGSLSFFPSGRADACGGFFCSQTPVIQVAERIVFSIEDNRTVVYVQLQYSGNDPSFAWIVPVPDVPEIEVGVGQAMFEALDAQTQPLFRTENGAAFAQEASLSAGCGASGGGFSAPPPEPTLTARYVPRPNVNVYAANRVGPYDYVVIDAAEAEDLNDWLGINGYRVIPGSESIVQQYLIEGMKLLAFKLAPGENTQALEPIKLTYPGTDGCMIPLRLTSIAAQPNLEIVAWVFAQARAVPENFGAVVVDPQTIGSPATYMSALGVAVDQQSEGRGFVTEFALGTSFLSARGDPTLERLLAANPYLTRMRTVIDPSEMTADPAFIVDPSAGDVSNVIVLRTGTALGSGTMLTIFALWLGMSIRRRRRRS
jgi:hypothetical protein